MSDFDSFPPSFNPNTGFTTSPPFDPNTGFTTSPPFDPNTGFTTSPPFDPNTGFTTSPPFDPNTGFTTSPPFDPNTGFDPGRLDPSIPPLPSFEQSLAPLPDASTVTAAVDTGPASNAADSNPVLPAATAPQDNVTNFGSGPITNPDGNTYDVSNVTVTGPAGQQVVTEYEILADGTIVTHELFEVEHYGIDHTSFSFSPLPVDIPAPGVSPLPVENPVPPQQTTPTDNPKQSPLAQGVGGFVTGAGLSQVPGIGSLIGPAAQSAGLVDKPTADFQKGYGWGSILGGIYQGISGAGMIMGGGGEAVGGVVGAPVSGGAALAVSAVGVSTATLGSLLVAQGATNISVGIQILMNAQMTNPTGSRPAPRQSEKFAEGTGTSVPTRSQPSYKGEKPTYYGAKDSVRPDFELPEAGVVVEVKNYDLSKGNAKLVENVVKQALKRAQELPAGTKQALVIDVRGQAISHSQLEQLFQQINAKSGNLFGDRWWVFMN
jgi:hypothetical protein